MRGYILHARAISFTKRVVTMQKKAVESEPSLFDEIEEAKNELARLYCRFDYENDPERMDEIIFLLCAAESKYGALMDKARRKAS